MAVPWAWAFDTPFKWTKQVASHFGGTRQGMAISWPGHIDDVGGIRTQFHHVIDIVPTILEAAGIRAPDMVDGIKQKPIEGVSMAYTFDKANANAPSKRDDAVLRDVRQPRHLPRRLVRRDDAARAALARGHQAAAAGDGLQVGALQHRRGLLAGQRPRGEDARQAEGDAGGCSSPRRAKYQVFPLDNSVLAAPADAAPERHRRSDDLHLPRRQCRHPGRPMRRALLNRDYTITAEITVPKGGAEGMIATMGGRFGGYGLYLHKGKPVFVYNLLNLKRYRFEGGVGGEDWLGRSLSARQAHDRVRLQVRRPGPRQGRHRHAIGRRHACCRSRRWSTRSRS